MKSPPASSSAARATMRANRSRDTGPELALRRELRALGVRYRVDYRGAPGRPDVALARERVAVFVDGCFWHGCPKCAKPLPKTHRAFWRAKIRRNAERAAEVTNALRDRGWNVVRIWEHRLRDAASARDAAAFIAGVAAVTGALS